MTNKNHLDSSIFLITIIFPTFSDASICNSPSALPSIVTVPRIPPSVEEKLPAASLSTFH